MSAAIRCGQCRWWRQKDEMGACELNPPVWLNADEFSGPGVWHQPFTNGMEIGCSRGELKATEPLNTIFLQQELISDLLHEKEPVREFINKVRELRTSWPGSMSFWTGVVSALDELDIKLQAQSGQKGGE